MILSIIIPVYNVEKFLDDCLSSLKFFDDKSDVEIIAVNDGSTDNSYEILKTWEKILNKLKVVSQPNQGLSSARNTGLSLACGENVSFIDSDDFVDAESLWHLLECAEQDGADIAIGDYWEFIDGHPETDRVLKSIPATPNHTYDGLDFFSGFYKPLQSVVVRNIYRRLFLIENNLRFHEGVYFEDVEFTPLAFSCANKVVYSGIPFYYYRKRGNSITTSRSSEKKVLDAICIWKILDNESSQISNTSVAGIFRELGFHCFLNQYSLFDSCLNKNSLKEAKALAKKEMKTNKYSVISKLFRVLPNRISHNLLKFLR